ncbi:condensation domain-containing protein [Chlorobium ferrooxidans]|nr:condensation domain-containing protein [Chlorobium ferrooxidans]
MTASETFDYLPVQKWFMTRPLEKRNHFNHSFLFRVNEPVDRERLQGALEKLSRHHGMLRAVYPARGGCFLRESAEIEVKELDIGGKSDAEIFEELTGWQNHFDLERGYLWQSGILRGYRDGSERIFLAIHHMVVDAASWSIIREDLKELFEGRPIVQKSCTYREWVDAVRAHGLSATDEERAYWRRSEVQQEEVRHVWQELREEGSSPMQCSRVEFSPEIVAKLEHAARAPGTPKISDLLLGALASAMYEVSGKRENWITVEKPGREGLSSPPDVSRTVGWFTVLFPLCLGVGSGIGESVMMNRERLRALPCKGIGYGPLYGYDNLPVVLFNYLDRLTGSDESSWQISLAEPSGESMSPLNRFGNIVDINGLGRKGKIGLWFESSLKEDPHRTLCEAFRKGVEEAVHWLNH